MKSKFRVQATFTIEYEVGDPNDPKIQAMYSGAKTLEEMLKVDLDQFENNYENFILVAHGTATDLRAEYKGEVIQESLSGGGNS